jgi:hypothetical protein
MQLTLRSVPRSESGGPVKPVTRDRTIMCNFVKTVITWNWGADRIPSGIGGE